MKIWKIVTVLLAVLLLAGCVGSVSGAVSEIKITGIDAPATGVKPDTTASTSTAGITLGTITWNIGSETTFNAETQYTVTIPVTSKSGYEFAGTVTATVNGKTAAVSKTTAGVSVSYTFDKTAAATTISEIKCTLDKPLAANTPQTSVTFSKPTSGLKSTVTWDTTDKKFVMGKKYAATVKIESTNDKAYLISSTATVKFNGGTISDIERGTNSIEFTYQFGETEPKGIADSLSFTITAPVVGKTPSKSLTANIHNDKVTGSLSWNTASAFQPDTSYTATITVNAKDGYIIKNTAAATVNGNPAAVVWESNTRAVVTYTFAQIASVSTVDVRFDAPATGDIAQTTATSVTTTPSGAAKSATIKWTPALVNNEFEAGVEYTAAVTIPISGTNTVFDKETIVYINGEQAVTSVSSDYKTLTATYTFPKTLFIPNPIEIIKEMFNLMLAIFNPASYVFL